MDTALYIAPKTDRGSLLSTEDRGGVRVETDRGRVRLIVADGASTAHRSGLLAELIVQSFLGDELPLQPCDNASYDRWRRQLSLEWGRRAETDTGDEWYLQTNLARGSAAAFAAVVVDRGTCWAVAVGDCCIFQVRRDRTPTCIASFPVRDWAAFNSAPALLHTDLERPVAWPTWTRLQVRSGDVIVGTSDGVASWVLAAAVEHAEVWRLLIEMTAADFASLLAEERANGTMVDDDAVLARIDVGSGR
jgi:hypothetical protein